MAGVGMERVTEWVSKARAVVHSGGQCCVPYAARAARAGVRACAHVRARARVRRHARVRARACVRACGMGRLRSTSTTSPPSDVSATSGRYCAGSVSSASIQTPSESILPRACRSAEHDTPMPTGHDAPWRGSRTTRTSWQKYLWGGRRERHHG
eukprot:5373226-Prymnesium_polylepis.1